jgi:23S rRNA pseudouridine2605 synthase
MAVERLQKIIARSGVASRRAAEALILAGRVRVNGRIVKTLGTKADSRKDKIEVDGRRLVREALAYVLLHKPRGVVTTLEDPEGRETVKDLLKKLEVRVVPVGRLDYQTSGALLLTNDGELVNLLLHPSRGIPRTYAVKVQGRPTIAILDRWRQGIRLEDGTTSPAEVFVISQGEGATWIQVTIREGRNRQIHRMGEATGHEVQRLKRTSFGGLSVEDLAPGEWRFLSRDEVRKLREQAGPPGPGSSTADGARARSGAGSGSRRPGSTSPSRRSRRTS